MISANCRTDSDGPVFSRYSTEDKIADIGFFRSWIIELTIDPRIVNRSLCRSCSMYLEFVKRRRSTTTLVNVKGSVSGALCMRRVNVLSSTSPSNTGSNAIARAERGP